MHPAQATSGIGAIEAPGASARARIPQHCRIWFACTLVAMANQADPPIWLLATSMPEQTFGAAWVGYWNIASTTTVTLLLFIVAGGVLGDLFGRRRVLLTGVSIFVVAAALSL